MTAQKTIHGVKRKAWADIHPDYKSIKDGIKYVLVMDENGATVSMPLKQARERKLI